MLEFLSIGEEKKRRNKANTVLNNLVPDSHLLKASFSADSFRALRQGGSVTNLYSFIHVAKILAHSHIRIERREEKHID